VRSEARWNAASATWTWLLLAGPMLTSRLAGSQIPPTLAGTYLLEPTFAGLPSWKLLSLPHDQSSVASAYEDVAKAHRDLMDRG
jgi:hypothetical protein